MKSRLRRLMDLSSIYLPVILMGLLTLGTWWLVRNAPKPQVVREAVVPGHEVDYYMRDFSVRSFDGTGALTSEIQGSKMRHYMDTDTLEIDTATLRSLRQDGSTTVATADRALSNADGSEVQLFGNAKVVRNSNKADAPQMEFRGEFLHAFVNEERVSSNKPVEIIRGKDRFTADSMVFNNITQVAELKGRVRGVLQPAR
ncbi:lipopolysaccharide export system protein LptC [Comamonas sp. BIGb0152]|uniref:LPS export ABC transporter periplasmic protein LptC n=1 Tax=Comamonas sp. BIGb0152 TaxID=2940601 RepID=UPI0021676CDE|nr:LPS export ABC transporter periplasmic protein LptC [Comamonas sp. BIGb0152]MCS4294565.1 lipopolysaccharide export system protein LptC [Comamonas sp. BIGb0152]